MAINDGDDGRLKFMDYNGHYSRYDIWGGPCPPSENHLIHPAFAKFFIYDDKQIILFTKKWLVFVEADDTIRIMNTDDTDAKETNLVVNALQNELSETQSKFTDLERFSKHQASTSELKYA